MTPQVPWQPPAPPPASVVAGSGALFSADWRNATYGNVGVATPGGVGNGSSSLVSDYDHAGVEAVDRLQFVRYPARRGLGSIRMEARTGDIDGTHNRTEMTATDPSKIWRAGDEMWFALSRMWDASYPVLSQTGAFMLFHQFYAQDVANLAGVSGSTVKTTADVTFPLAGGTVPVTDASLFNIDGTATVGGQTFTYTGKTATTLTGCTGGTTATIASGTAVTQAAATTTLNGAITFPLVNASVAVADTSTFPSSGMVQVNGLPFTYTGKDATHFLGCNGGGGNTNAAANGATVTGQISGGSPALALELSSDGSQIIVHVRGGDKPNSQYDASPTNVSKLLTPPTKGVWHDFLIHAKWSTGTDGLIEVFWRQAGGQFPATPQVSVSGPNVTSVQGHALPMYAETGIYSDTGAATLVGYHGGLLGAHTRQDAEAFWQQAAPQSAPQVGFSPPDYAKKFASFDPGLIASGKALSSGLVLLTRVNTPGPAQPITNLYLALVAAGASITAAGAWAYVWNAQGTLLQTSADQTTPWTTAGNQVDTLMDALAVPMSFTTTPESWVWVGLHVPSATTYPSFGRIAAEGNGSVNIGLTTSQLRTSQLLTQAAKVTANLTLPLAANAVGGSWVWAALA